MLRTFSKIYGLAGLRVGYGVGPADLVTAIGKVRRAFDLSTPAQVAALASLGDDAEVERRRRANEEARGELERALRGLGFQIATLPSPTSSTRRPAATPACSSTRSCGGA